MRFDRQPRYFRTGTSEGDPATMDAWTLSVADRLPGAPPLALPGFDFPCRHVSREEAVTLAREAARRLGLPLREVDVEPTTALPAPPRQRGWVPPPVAEPPAFPAPPLPPGTRRLGLRREPDGSAAELTVEGTGWRGLLGPAAGTIVLAVFVPITLLAVPLILPRLLARGPARTHLRVGASGEVSMFCTLRGRQFGRRRDLPPITDVVLDEGGASLVVSGGAGVVAIGERMTPAEGEWLRRVLLDWTAPHVSSKGMPSAGR